MKSYVLSTIWIIAAIVERAFPCKPAKVKEEGKRIVGGDDTTIQDRPYQLLLEIFLNNEWKPTCGAVILTRDVAITAGHCLIFGDKSVFRLVTGDTKRSVGAKHMFKNMEIHPNLTMYSEISNDVALIQVKQPFEMSATTRAIELTDMEPPIGTVGEVSGWGQTKNGDYNSLPRDLQKVSVRITNRKVCNRKIQGFGLKIGKTMLCATANSKGPCMGDDGGPLTHKGKLIGVGSLTGNCGEPNTPYFFANVFANKDWIRKTQAMWSQ